MKKIKHYISGSYYDGGEIRTNLNPKTKEGFSSFPIGREPEVSQAVKAANDALLEWQNQGIESRIKQVLSLVELLRNAYGNEGEVTDLKLAINDEIGKPLPEADIEVLECAEFIEYYCSIASDFLSEKSIEINKELWPTKESFLSYSPLGVVAIIKPWNYPLEMIAWSLGPALLAGNSVVIKPSEKSPYSAFKLAELIKESSIPDGVVNIVQGDRKTGQILVSHPDIRMISFTGSVPAGRNVATMAGKQLKKVSLELGGNDTAIVDKDVDLDLAANGLVWGAFCNSGQVCVGIKKAYIHTAVYDELKEKIRSLIGGLRPGIEYGPIVDQAQFDRFSCMVQDTLKDGNILLEGGKKGQSGFYYEPTMLEIQNEASVALGEECFGPLLPIIRVDNIEDAISASNDAQYGLGASVWTSNIENAKNIASRLDVGMVWVNDVNVAFPEAAWGGRKFSGFGSELGPTAFYNYISLKHTSIESSQNESRDWWYPYEE